MACNIDQIPVSNARWSERPSASGMEQVRELLALIDRRGVDGVIVVTNLLFSDASLARRGHTLHMNSEGILMGPKRCLSRLTESKSSGGLGCCSTSWGAARLMTSRGPLVLGTSHQR